MVFNPPLWVAQMPMDPPDSISIAEFMSSDIYGRDHLQAKARNPFTCGLTGKTYTTAEVVEREHYLARAIFKKLGFDHENSKWDRVVALFSLNTIDYIPLTHAVHRLSGIVAPVNPAASSLELKYQIQSSNAVALFTCVPLLDVALKAAKAVGMPNDRIFVLPMQADAQNTSFTTTDELINEGKMLPELRPARWSKGQGTRQVAFLCFSSGTSGLPKAVMVTHYNVIANIIQLTTYESFYRKQHGIESQTLLGLLPFSHAYGLIVVAHVAPYRGDEVIVLPKFKLETLLMAVQRFQIKQINIAPPILIQMIANHEKCKKFNLRSIRYVYTGGAPLGHGTINKLSELYPEWHVGQVYGMTETAVVITSTSESDIFPGSAGSLLPSMKARIVNSAGKEVKEYDTPGELVVQGPSLCLGYLNNEKATAETFIWDDEGRWIKTGDEAIVRKSPNGHEHFIIVDRIKELIKVKGMQVAPAELEAHLLTQPFVSNCAVIEVPHKSSGEVPKAFVVRSRESAGESEQEMARVICEYVQQHKAHYKWLTGGIQFVEDIPKSSTGKIIRRELREQEKKARKAKEANL